jgi:hypothetical protein
MMQEVLQRLSFGYATTAYSEKLWDIQKLTSVGMVTYACAVNKLWDKLNNEQTRGVGEGRSERKMMRNKEKGRGGGRNRKQNRTLSSRLGHFL